MKPLSRALLIAGGAATAAATALLAAPWYYQPRRLTRAMQRTWDPLVFDVDTEDPLFSLTFDDGPHLPYTEAVLDTLERYGVRATFFLMGEQVERHPATFRRILDAGHEVGNHFYDSRATVFLTAADMLTSLDRTEALLEGANTHRLVRPASGFLRPELRDVLLDRGYTIVIGSAYTSDCTKPPRAYMRWAFKQMLEPGRIVILHDGRKERQRTVDVLPHILDEARALGLGAVPVSELLAARRVA